MDHDRQYVGDKLLLLRQAPVLRDDMCKRMRARITVHIIACTIDARSTVKVDGRDILQIGTAALRKGCIGFDAIGRCGRAFDRNGVAA